MAVRRGTRERLSTGHVSKYQMYNLATLTDPNTWILWLDHSRGIINRDSGVYGLEGPGVTRRILVAFLRKKKTRVK